MDFRPSDINKYSALQGVQLVNIALNTDLRFPYVITLCLKELLKVLLNLL